MQFSDMAMSLLFKHTLYDGITDKIKEISSSSSNFKLVPRYKNFKTK